MNCDNLCFRSERICNHCKKNYDVSSGFYKPKRPTNDCYVVGYLVKNKQGKIQGILNKDTQFNEFARIDESTVETI